MNLCFAFAVSEDNQFEKNILEMLISILFIHKMVMELNYFLKRLINLNHLMRKLSMVPKRRVGLLLNFLKKKMLIL